MQHWWIIFLFRESQVKGVIALDSIPSLSNSSRLFWVINSKSYFTFNKTFNSVKIWLKVGLCLGSFFKRELILKIRKHSYIS